MKNKNIPHCQNKKIYHTVRTKKYTTLSEQKNKIIPHCQNKKTKKIYHTVRTKKTKNIPHCQNKKTKKYTTLSEQFQHQFGKS